jgi:site-specific recombinase XerD
MEKKPTRSPLARSFGRHMRAENRSERTIATYLHSLRQAETFLTARGTTVEAATRADLEAFMADLLARRTPSTAAMSRYKVLYGWLVDEEELDADPMAKMKPPIVPTNPVPTVPADGLKLSDVDLDLDVLLVLGKGRRERTLPFGRKAGEALDRYLRARSRHKHAVLPWLWLGQRGRLTEWGLVQMLRRRGAETASRGCILISSGTPSPMSGWCRVAARPI